MKTRIEIKITRDDEEPWTFRQEQEYDALLIRDGSQLAFLKRHYEEMALRVFQAASEKLFDTKKEQP